jgi:hypothetical protein
VLLGLVFLRCVSPPLGVLPDSDEIKRPSTREYIQSCCGYINWIHGKRLYLQKTLSAKDSIYPIALNKVTKVDQHFSQRVREAYSFICANYTEGDEIILIGFSRGAFTVRSVANMIADLGLLTREGSRYFYPIFKDMKNWRNKHHYDEFPTIPFPNKPKGSLASEIYRARLEQVRRVPLGAWGRYFKEW